MLGAASEHLILRLANEIADADANIAASLRAKLRGNALPIQVEVRKYFDLYRAKLPRDLQESVGTTFSAIADSIRIARNEAGHPVFPAMTREQVFVNLQLFPLYRRWVIGASKCLPIT